jgi:hypothetical protein
MDWKKIMVALVYLIMEGKVARLMKNKFKIEIQLMPYQSILKTMRPRLKDYS